MVLKLFILNEKGIDLLNSALRWLGQKDGNEASFLNRNGIFELL